MWVLGVLGEGWPWHSSAATGDSHSTPRIKQCHSNTASLIFPRNLSPASQPVKDINWGRWGRWVSILILKVISCCICLGKVSLVRPPMEGGGRPRPDSLWCPERAAQGALAADWLSRTLFGSKKDHTATPWVTQALSECWWNKEPWQHCRYHVPGERKEGLSAPTGAGDYRTTGMIWAEVMLPGIY